jgi:hypothetical protein
VTGKKTASGFTFTGNTRKDGTMTVTSIKKTTKKTVKLSSKITVDGLKYTVTKIGANAFKNATKATKIVIPSTITRVNAKAFSGLSKTVKTIQFNTTKAPEIAKTAFKGVSTKNITITVTKKMSSKEYKNFKKALKAAGFKGTIKRAS